MPHQNDLTELVTVIGASGVRCLDKCLPFPANALDSILSNTKGRLYSATRKLEDVVEEKQQATTMPRFSASSAADLVVFARISRKCLCSRDRD